MFTKYFSCMFLRKSMHFLYPHACYMSRPSYPFMGLSLYHLVKDKRYETRHMVFSIFLLLPSEAQLTSDVPYLKHSQLKIWDQLVSSDCGRTASFTCTGNSLRNKGRSSLPTVTNTKYQWNTLFSVVEPRRQVEVCQRLKGTCCLLHQGGEQ